MTDVNVLAPYVSNPLALVAFVLLVILLAMLKVPASSTFLKVLACILIVPTRFNAVSSQTQSLKQRC